MGNETNETGITDTAAGAQPPSPPSSNLHLSWWRRIALVSNRFAERRTRRTLIAMAMAVAAALSAVSAFRASDEERKSTTCDHQFSEAQTYELVQRQHYLDAEVEHERWSDRYQLAMSRSDTLLRHADSIRETTRGGSNASAGLFDVEAQIENAVARTIRPVRDFTDPHLPEGANLERRLRTRAEDDVKDLGIANRCAVHDDASALPPRVPSDTSDPTLDNYLEPLHRQVAFIHRKALEDALAVVGFVIVLVLFTLSEVCANGARLTLEIAATLGLPASWLFAVTRSDEGMKRYLLAPTITLIGLFLLGWFIRELMALRTSAPGTRPEQPPPANDAVEGTFQPVDLDDERTLAARDRTAAPSAAPSGTGPRSARQAPALTGARLKAAVRGVQIESGIVLFILVLLVLIAGLEYLIHTTRTWPIFTLALMSATAFGIVIWRTINTMSEARAARRPGANGIDAGKGVFGCAAAALVAVGLGVAGAPLVALIVERRSSGWLIIVGVACALLTAVVAVLLACSERRVRTCAVRLAATEADSAATAAAKPPETPVGPPSEAAQGPEGTHEPTEPPTEVGEPTHERYPRLPTVGHRFGGFVVSAIAITALCSAFLTYFYTREGGQANDFAAKAASEQLELMRSSSRQAIVAYQTIESLMTLRNVDLRRLAAKELRAKAAAEGSPELFAIWDHEARRWGLSSETIANRVAPDPSDASSKETVSRVFQSEKGPNDDPSFPAKLFKGSTILTSAERLALWDAYDEANTASEVRANVFLAVATFFAIALYLFGQSLGMGRDNHAAHVLTAMATLLVLFGLFLTWQGMRQPIPAIERLVAVPENCRSGNESRELPIADAAAMCYAQAELLMALARGPDDYRKAREAYETATRDDLRPGFTLASYRAIRAMLQITTPQRTEHGSIIDPGELKDIVSRERTVIETLDARDRAVPLNLRESFGFHEYLLAVNGQDAILLDDALKNLKIPTEKNKKDAQARFRFAAALLAAGRENESRKLYLLALGAPGDDQVRIAAINDLELLRQICPFSSREGKRDTCALKLKTTIANREAAIIRTLWATKRHVTLNANNPRLKSSVMPGGIGWHLQVARPLPNGLPLVMVVYQRYKRQNHNLWYIVASASGPVQPRELTRGYGVDLIGFRNMLRRNATCLQGGETYRVELRLGKHVIAGTQATVPRTLPSFGSVILHEQGLTACVPDGTDGWAKFNAHPGHLEASYRDANKLSGADFFAFFSPRDPTQQTRDELRRRAIDDMLQRIRGRGISGRHLQPVREPCLRGPGVQRSERVAYAFAPLEVLTQSWTSKDGLVHVALIWRDDSTGLSGRAVACRVLASVTTTDDDNATGEARN